VTWNERWKTLDKRENLGYLVLNVVLLSAILGSLALVSGVGFGFARVILSRLFPGRIRTYAQANEVISLRLAESPSDPPRSEPSPSRQTT
jgi:hypothetical protein